MYKQRCIGTEGPLMPVICICSCGLILYAATDAGVRALGWHHMVYFISVFIFLVASILIYRYTRVSMEYVWFGGQFIVRRIEKGHITRIAIAQTDLLSIRDRQGSVGNCTCVRGKNCCATLYGRIMCCALCYRDEHGHVNKILFQPAPELRKILWHATNFAIERQTA